MILEYDVLNGHINDVDRCDPFQVVGAFFQVLRTYDPTDTKEFFEKLQWLMGNMQPITDKMKKDIQEKMLSNYKYNYLSKSFFIDATVENDYTPTLPFKLPIKEDENANLGRGFRIFYVKSAGADEYRSIVLRLAKNGFYYIWGDSFMNILDDIKFTDEVSPWY